MARYKLELNECTFYKIATLQIGRVEANCLISFFAENNDLAALTRRGALFQSLGASPMHEFLTSSDIPDSVNLSEVSPLVTLALSDVNDGTYKK